MPAPATTFVKVPLLGAVPGAKVDFARFSFQVPRFELPGWANVVPANTTTNPSATIAKTDV
jgi:hypothetical protein